MKVKLTNKRYLATIFLVIFVLLFIFVLSGENSERVEIKPEKQQRQEFTPEYYSHLYQQHKNELLFLRNKMERFCKRALAPQFNLFQTCNKGILEMELLYLRIRALKPDAVLELSSSTGYATLVILQALHDNGPRSGKLVSMDIFQTDFPPEAPQGMRGRWEFVKGDVRENAHYMKRKIDYLHSAIKCSNAGCVQWFAEHFYARAAHLSVENVYNSHSYVPSTVKFEPSSTLLLEWGLSSAHVSNWHTCAFGVYQSFAEKLKKTRETLFGHNEAGKLIGHCQACGWKGDFSSSVYFSNVIKPCS